MTRPARLAATALSLALLTGCGSAAPGTSGPGATAPPGGTLSLDISLATTGGTWAVVVMGGSAAAHNNFWQLFARPAASTRWTLATPPGVADNGGLVLAATGGRSLITAFRPSQYLTYTPLTVTGDGGRAWSPAGPLDGALASVPDALAAAPATRRLLALTASGTAKLAAPGYTRWSTLATQRALAATPPGRRCGLTRLTAATFTPTGIPLLAGACSHPGTAGIFAGRDGSWQPAGPPIPAALARQDITVLRLARTTDGIAALLASRTSLFAAWSAGTGGRWAISPPLRLGRGALGSASFGPGGTAAITLAGDRGEVIAGSGSRWHPLPALPPGTATLAPGPRGQADALAVHQSTLTVWQLPAGGSRWAKAQVINVPIQYGSSG